MRADIRNVRLRRISRLKPLLQFTPHIQTGSNNLTLHLPTESHPPLTGNLSLAHNFMNNHQFFLTSGFHILCSVEIVPTPSHF